MTGGEIIERCQLLARMSETPGAITRTFLCPAMHDVHRTLRTWMEEAGMSVAIDAAGNVRGFYPASRPDASRLLIGSHVDTVPDGGAYDGVLGVVLAIALVRSLAGRRLTFAIEAIAFSEEEGVRFGVPFIGSRALTGTLDDAMLARTDARGVTIAQAISDFGLDPGRLPDAAGTGREACPTLGYLEFHIEQGPVLDSLDLPLGVVTAIVGQTRGEVTFTGAANHAGTTPMHLRRDALAAAARWTSLVERTARATSGVVATVGRVDVYPGATNVVPGEVRASLDVRHADDDIRRAVVYRLRCAAEKIGARRNVSVGWRQHLDQPAVACDPGLTAHLARAVENAAEIEWGGPPGPRGTPRPAALQRDHRQARLEGPTGASAADQGVRPTPAVHYMTSGAGHDAMILAAIAPVAMLFVRSPGGISHHPAESVYAADVDAALAAGLLFLEELERSHV